MGINGTAAYFVEHKPPSLSVAIRGLVGVAGSDIVRITASVSKQPDILVRSEQGRAVFDWSRARRSHPTRWLGVLPSVEDLVRVARTYNWVYSSIVSKRCDLLAQAIERDIPPEISARAWVAQFGLRVGLTDWAEESPVGNPPECIYYGRSEIALSLFGYGSPADPAKYREMIFQIPEFIQLQRDIEGVLGPVKRCIYWDF